MVFVVVYNGLQLFYGTKYIIFCNTIKFQSSAYLELFHSCLTTMTDVANLISQLQEKDKEILRLRELLSQRTTCTDSRDNESARQSLKVPEVDGRLSRDDIARYSRQLILSELGVKGQVALGRTSVLIVGCGGLGCPAAIYLAGAGVGRLGLVDHDIVELNNLHRQILHSEANAEKMPKAVSAAHSCKKLNSRMTCDIHCVMLTSSNALDIVRQYDIVVDATDNVATRYLLSDACVLSGRPLVSGGALRFEGQLTVYNYQSSPCYRCLYPQPPLAEMVTNCSDAGVLGPVVGVIGSLQAVEVIKIATGIGHPFAGRLVLYDGLDGTFHCVKLRGRQKTCAVCGDSPTVTKLIDYESFCGVSAGDRCRSLNILPPSERINASDYAAFIKTGKPHLLVDVRIPVELEITKLATTTHNVPVDEFTKPTGCSSLLKVLDEDVREQASADAPLPLFVVCRRGNDSQLAVQKLQLFFSDVPVTVKDIIGGLAAWSNEVDKNFPIY